MTLGLEVIKFLLEQHEDNLPIVQKWLDKWFWRGTRLLSLVAMMMDYMLPNKVMSWKEAWEVYFEDAGGALFKDLARYGIRMPKYADVIEKEKAVAKQEALDSGKPEEIAEKMVVGKMRKYLDSVVLLRQPFVKDDKQQIQDILPKGVTIKAFKRLTVG